MTTHTRLNTLTSYQLFGLVSGFLRGDVELAPSDMEFLFKVAESQYEDESNRAELVELIERLVDTGLLNGNGLYDHMPKAKYVTGVIGDCRAAILFPDYVTHADAAACFQGSILGGGFYHYTDDEVIVYGESISLKVRSNPEEDAVLVGLALNHPAYIR